MLVFYRFRDDFELGLAGIFHLKVGSASYLPSAANHHFSAAGFKYIGICGPFQPRFWADSNSVFGDFQPYIKRRFWPPFAFADLPHIPQRCHTPLPRAVGEELCHEEWLVLDLSCHRPKMDERQRGHTG